jgi:hypothetical protein
MVFIEKKKFNFFQHTHNDDDDDDTIKYIKK